MEIYNGWIRYTDTSKGTSLFEYHQEAERRLKESLDNTYIDVAEVQAEACLKGIYDCIEKGKKHFKGDFFIEVIVRTDHVLGDRHVTNLFRAVPICPKPQYARTVVKYHSNSGEIEPIWVIPTPARCEEYKVVIESTLKEEEKEVYKNAMAFESGELQQLSNIINDSIKKEDCF